MILGIGGVSRSGKTTLTKLLKQRLFPDAYLIHQDDYVVPENKMPHWNEELDWEHPACIDFNRMSEAILGATKRHNHVIVEGFLIFYDPTVMSLFDKTVFIQIDRETFFDRKRMDLRWGRVSDDYMQHIWNSYLKYGKRHLEKADLTISGKEIEGNWSSSLNPLLGLLTS